MNAARLNLYAVMEKTEVGSECTVGNDGSQPRALMAKSRTGDGVSAWKLWLSSYGEDDALVVLLVMLTLAVQCWTASGASAVPVSGRALLARSVVGDTLDSVGVSCASVGAHDASGESSGLGCLHVRVWMVPVVLICWLLRRSMAPSVSDELSSSSRLSNVESVHAGTVARAIVRLQAPVDRAISRKKTDQKRVPLKHATVVQSSRPVAS